VRRTARRGKEEVCMIRRGTSRLPLYGEKRQNQHLNEKETALPGERKVIRPLVEEEKNGIVVGDWKGTILALKKEERKSKKEGRDLNKNTRKGGKEK